MEYCICLIGSSEDSVASICLVLRVSLPTNAEAVNQQQVYADWNHIANVIRREYGERCVRRRKESGSPDENCAN
ncbi:hypothetical protein PV325_008971 [Microctonus aethiopoides]|nr:hypothetical protein PV325_008971 [Microctonus aethiopoides]KAK0077030.1 hypothetical protein PV326_010355 [Microctonus aethiopoides]